MKKNNLTKDDPSILPLVAGQDLRRQAETKLSKSRQKKATAPGMDIDNLHLAHELEVHQIELEMQNEELAQARAELEAALRQYIDLYDFAPVGYFTLARDGAIQQANLNGAQILGTERGALLKRRFGLFVADESRPAFNAFLERVFASREKETCEIAFQKNGREQTWAHMEASCAEVARGKRAVCNAVLVDVTAHKQSPLRLEASPSQDRGFSVITKTDNRIPHILIVDDDPGLLATMSDILKMRGFEPVSAQTGNAALAQLEDRDFDAALIDLHLASRDTSGLDVLSAIRTRSPQTECILLTGQATQDSAIKAIQMNAFGYYQKPFDMEQVMLTIQRAVEKRKADVVLREGEARYRSILEDQTELICRYLPDGRLSYVNEAYARYYGETAQKLINTNFIPNIPEPDISMVINKIAAITPQEPVIVYEHRIIKPDGEIRWQRWTHRGIFDDVAGKLIEHQAVGNDITERKRADEARSQSDKDHIRLRTLQRRQADEVLRQSEARYRSILEDQTELICRYLPDGRLSFVNEAYARYYGGTAQQLINTNFIPHIPEPDISMVINKIAAITPQEPVIVYEHHITKPDGEIRWQRWTHRGIYDAAGNLIEHQAVGNDITERKQAEEALRESEERFRLAIQATKDGLWEWNISTNQEFFSPRWCEIIGYSFDDPELAHTYNSWAERIHPDDYERVMSALTDHLEKGARYDVDYRHRHKSGEYHWQNTSGQALFDEQGKPTKMVGRISDITKRKRVEEALRMAEVDYRAIFERAPVGIFRSTVDGHFVKINQAMAKMYGYQLPEEMIDEIKSIAAQIYVDSSLRREFQSLLAEDGEVQGFVVQNRRRDGSMFWVSMNAHTVKNETGEILYYEGFVEDITERKQAEEQIQSLAKFPAENPNPVLRVTRDGILLYINEAGLRFLSQWNLHIGETVPPILQEVASHSMKNGTTQTFDIEHGDRLYAFYVAPIVSAGYANLYGHDITESRQVKALRDAEARYHILFDQSPYGVLLVDPETGNTIEANDIASRQLGYTRDEFSNLKISDYEASEKPEQTAQHTQKIVSAGSDDFETLHRTKSGEIRNVHVWVETLQLNERVFFYTIFQDITERKRMEEANETYSREITLLEERQRIASDLHDAVSQTLFSARLAAENLLRQPDRQTDSFTHSLIDLNRLVRSASGEIRLILVELRNNAILNVSLNTLLTNLIDSGMARTNANLVFQCHVDDLILPVQIKLAFYRIAQEATSNAIKHGKPGSIHCILRENKQTLEMIIQDDGTGFSIDKVSDDHFGLQIMRERAEQAGVELAIATAPGNGTSVTVCWKREQL